MLFNGFAYATRVFLAPNGGFTFAELLNGPHFHVSASSLKWCYCDASRRVFSSMSYCCLETAGIAQLGVSPAADQTPTRPETESSASTTSGSSSPHRPKRMRTSFKHHQLRQMKAYFAMNHNPDSKELRQLAQKTGLSKRVLQVRLVRGQKLLAPNAVSLTQCAVCCCVRPPADE